MLKTVLDNLDGIDEAFHSLYDQTDDRYILKVEGVDLHPEVANLKSAYERVKEDKRTLASERDQLRAKVAGLPEDFDPTQWEKLKKGGKADPEEVIQLRKTLEAERDGWKTKAEEAAAQLRRATVERTLDQSLAEQGVTNPTFLKAARALLGPQIQTDANGTPIVETDMGPVPLADHIKRWVADEGKAFVTPPQGGGARGNDGKSGAAAKKAAQMTAQEKSLYIRENGLDAWKAKLAQDAT